MSQPLPRYTDQHLEDERKLARILIESGGTAPTRVTLELADPQDLRGIPCIARGVGGTSPGTDPLRALINQNP